MKTRNRILSAILIVVMLIGIVPTVAVAADTQTEASSTQTTTRIVPFAAPVIFADAGETVVLLTYNVMFSAATVTPAHKITWTSDSLTVTNGSVTVPSKGVYTVTATSGASTKTIYIIAKEQTETEYVLYEKDFSTVESWDALVEEGWTWPETASGHTITVESGKLQIHGRPHKNISQIILPWWLSAFGDYTIEAGVEFYNREWTSRFWAITYDHQSNTSTGLYPYNYFKISDPTADDGTTPVAIDGRIAQWSWQGGVDGAYSKDMYQTGEYNYKLDIYGTHLDAYIDGTQVLDTEYPKQNATGGIGFLVRGASIRVSDIKITLDKEKIEALYDKFVESANPAVYADVNETVDLSEYAVTFNGAAMPADALAWSSDDITVTDNTVTPTAAGVYKLTATVKTQPTTAVDMTTSVYLLVKNPEDTEYVLYDKDYSTVTSVDELTTEGFVMAEIPDGNTVTVENGALAIKGDGSNDTYGNVNTRVILPTWLGDFGDYNLSSDVKITAATNTNRYFSLTYRAQNDSSIAKAYYPVYCASYRANGLTNLSYAKGLNSGGTPDWQSGIDGTTVSDINNGETHNYAISVSGNTVKSYVDGTKVVGGDYIGVNANSAFEKGYLGYFLRDMDIEIYNTKVTVKEKKLDNYEKLVKAVNPAILANTGDTVDLTKYAVMYDDDTVLYEDIVWASDDITIEDGKVTPTAAGVYKFTVTAEDLTKNVYVLVKNLEDTEYVLYDIDYSDVSSVDELTAKGFVIAEQPNNVTVGIENGALAIDGSANTWYKFCRILLPEWLGDFGNYSMSSDIKTLASPNTNRYFAFMYRVQNDASMEKAYYPYYTASFRARGYTHNLSYAAGYADSTVAWGATGVNMAGTASLLDDTVHNFSVSVYGNNVKVASDDTVMTDSDYIGVNTDSDFDSGYLGYLVIDQKVEIYNTRVVYMPSAIDEQISMADVDEAPSNVIMPASVITYINSKADLEAIEGYSTAPATAILRVDEDMNVVDESGSVITTTADALTYLGNRVMPAFYVKDEAATDAVISFVKDNGLYDIFAVSDDATLIKRAKNGYNMIRGILDFSGKTVSEDDVYSIRKATNESSSRICILPENLVSKKNVDFLLNLEIAVWVINDDTAVNTVKNIVSGAGGIITQDVNSLVSAYTEYFPENTMVRPLIYVGHQGVYTLEQPNTVKGMLRAYELGAAALETDVHLSKDGVIISMHDETLDRASTGTGYISDYTYEELQQFEVDQHGGADHEPIATLEDHFNAIKGLDVALTVEIKTSNTDICQKLVDLINEYDIADQINVSTFDITQILLLKSLMPELSVGLLDGSIAYDKVATEEAIYNMLKMAQRYDTIYCSTAAGLTLDIARAAFDRGYSISPSTTDDKSTLSTHIFNGAQKVCTNYTQYISDTIKELHTDKSEYYSNASEIEVDINTLTYSRTSAPVTDVQLLYVDGDDIFTYQDGKLVADGEGTATLMFSYACESTAGETYNVVTEPFTATVDIIQAPTITATSDNVATLETESDVLRVYWGYIGEENTEYKWFNDFKALCGDTFTAEYAPKNGDTYALTKAGFYRFVVKTAEKDLVYTIEVTSEDNSLPVIAGDGSFATLTNSDITAKKVYWGYIGAENTVYSWSGFKAAAGDTFTADFNPTGDKKYRMTTEGYYRFVVVYDDQNGKSRDLVYTVKCDSTAAENAGTPVVTVEENKVTLGHNDTTVNKMYIGYFGEDEVSVSNWADYKANAVSCSCIRTPDDGYSRELKNTGCYVVLVNYTDENSKTHDVYYTFTVE